MLHTVYVTLAGYCDAAGSVSLVPDLSTGRCICKVS